LPYRRFKIAGSGGLVTLANRLTKVRFYGRARYQAPTAARQLIKERILAGGFTIGSRESCNLGSRLVPGHKLITNKSDRKSTAFTKAFRQLP
jgi:hypothetical protein